MSYESLDHPGLLLISPWDGCGRGLAGVEEVAKGHHWQVDAGTQRQVPQSLKPRCQGVREPLRHVAGWAIGHHGGLHRDLRGDGARSMSISGTPGARAVSTG